MGNVEGVQSDGPVDSPRPCDLPVLVEEYGKWVLLLLDESPGVCHSVDTLRGDTGDPDTAIREQSPVRMEASHELLAVGAPGSAEKEQHRVGVPEVCEGNLRSVSLRQREIRCG